MRASGAVRPTHSIVLFLAFGLLACGSSSPSAAADAGGDGSAVVKEICSLLTQAGCQPTERCGEMMVAGTTGTKIACGAAGTGGAGATCKNNGDCDRTTICESSSSACMTLCDTSAAKTVTCGAGLVCQALGGEKAIAAHAGVCIANQTCNEITNEGCPADKQCLPSSGALAAACFAVTSGVAGDACVSNACAKGFICMQGKCHLICDASGALADHGCPAGVTCQGLVLTGPDGKAVPNDQHLGSCP